LWHHVDPQVVRLKFVVDTDFFLWSELWFFLVLLEKHLGLGVAELHEGLDEITLRKLAAVFEFLESEGLMLIK